MRTRHLRMLAVILAAVGAPRTGEGQASPAAAAAQRHALAKLAFMDGIWSGSAWFLLPSGERHVITQTERVGPFLDGAIKVIEGRGYEEDGTVSLRALGIISFDTDGESYAFRGYAQGRVGDFTLEPTADGYTWQLPAGPTTLRYEAHFEGGVWKEVADRLSPTGPPVRFFEMTLHRLGDTDWPAAAPVEPR